MKNNAEDVVIYKNRYIDNDIYGIDPHDRSKNLIIAHNFVTGTQKKHGIILSRDVDDSFVIYNEVFDNVGSGIMMDRSSSNNTIAYNKVYRNAGDGITLYESSNKIVAHNIIEKNKVGIRIRNTQDTFIWGGRIALNEKQAFKIYEDDLADTDRDFEMDPVIPISTAIIQAVDVESNSGFLRTDGFESLLIEDIDWDKATLSSNKYYGELKPYARKLEKFESKYDGFLITSED